MFMYWQVTPDGALVMGTTYSVRVKAYNGVAWSEVGRIA